MKKNVKIVTDVYGKTWTRATVQDALKTSDRFLLRSLIVIYNRQTADEQRSKEVRHRNGVGFTASDVVTLTKFAQMVKNEQLLLSHEMYEVRRLLPKYWVQLLDEIAAVAAAAMSNVD